MAAVILAWAREVLYIHDDDVQLAKDCECGRSLHCRSAIAGRADVSSLVFADDARDDKKVATDKDTRTCGEFFSTLCC